MENFGLTDWDDVEIKTGNRTQTKAEYMRLKEGDNVIRLLTKPHEFKVHSYKAHPDDPGFGKRILSSIYHGSDPLIDAGSKPKRRWLLGIIDRSTQSYKLLDISVTVFKAIQGLVRDEDWGEPTQYDINIKVDKNGGATGYYSVIPKSKKPLSAADIEIKEKIDLEDIKRRCTPPTPEKVLELMNDVNAKSPNFKKGTAVTAQKDSSEDDDFPSADGSDE
jgi:hypothetical protein